jgi:ADP-heptose:LPS heptosyltransferase
VNIVLTRLDRVGDLILSTPAIASVRRSWPRRDITLVCSAHNAVVVERNPTSTRCIGRAAESLAALVRKRRFRGACDLAIALAPCAPDFALVGATRAPIRVGYTYVRRYVARLTARLYLTRVAISEADPALASACRLSRAPRSRADCSNWFCSPAGRSSSAISSCRSRTSTGAPSRTFRPAASPFISGRAGSPSGSTLESTLDADREVAARFRAAGRRHVRGRRARASRRVRAAGVADAVVGGLSFAQWAAVFEKSRVVVTVDTGATHVASATRRPTVVLFEHRYFHLNSQEWSPYRVPSVCLRKPAGARIPRNSRPRARRSSPRSASFLRASPEPICP